MGANITQLQEKLLLNISDSNFAHDVCSVAGKTPKSVKWCRKMEGDPRIHFYTDSHCFGQIYTDRKNVAWLLEPRSISPHIYDNFSKVDHKFDIILTHDDQLLSLPNAYHSTGGCWIGGELGLGQMRIYEKSKFCSIVSSNKQFCPLHVERYNTAKSLMEKEFTQGKVDVFGFDDWRPIINSLRHYMFSVIYENQISRSFWTEKLLNCFATGTIPIYMGATDIDLFFASNGIIRFSSRDELYYILNNLTIDDYYSRMNAIRENFERCKYYEITEDTFLRKLDMKGLL